MGYCGISALPHLDNILCHRCTAAEHSVHLPLGVPADLNFAKQQTLNFPCGLKSTVTKRNNACRRCKYRRIMGELFSPLPRSNPTLCAALLADSSSRSLLVLATVRQCSDALASTSQSLTKRGRMPQRCGSGWA